MRHRNKTLKLGRKTQHRRQMLANLVCSLIKHGRVRTTLRKARAAASLADRMVTLGKRGALHHRRLAVARLHQEDMVRKLFSEIAPRCASRNGGYTRVIHLGARIGDAAETAFLEWVDGAAALEAAESAGDKKEKKPAAMEAKTTKAAEAKA